MFMTSNQLAAASRNRKRDERHNKRMAQDAEYREKIERAGREYDEFCARFGYPD